MSSDDKSNSKEPTVRWVTFQLAGENYAVNVLSVHEVLKSTDITPVPGAPSAVRGILNLRGNVVTVLDGRQLFNLPPAPMTEETRILIVEVGGQMVGLVVDAVAEVIDLSPSDMEPPPGISAEESAAYIAGVVNLKDGLVILLDLSNILHTLRMA